MKRQAKLGLSILFILMALILQLIVWESIKPFAWFIFSPAVFISALICGWEGGLLATGLSMAIVWYVFMPPEMTWVGKDYEPYSMIGFAITGLLYSFFSRHVMNSLRLNAEIKQAQKENLQLKMIMDTLIDPLITFNEIGTINSFNIATAHIFGYQPEELSGMNIQTLIPSFDTNDNTFTCRCDTTGIQISGKCQTEGRKKDGTIFQIETAIGSTTNRTSTIIVASIRDISEQKKYENELIEKTNKLFDSESQLKIVLDGLTDLSVILLTTDGYVKNWNKGAEKIRGYTYEEAIGKHASAFFTPSDLEKKELERIFEIAVKDGRYIGEGMRMRKDHSRFWAETVVYPAYDNNNLHVGYVVGTRDITERKLIELERIKHTQELERSNQDLDDFAYIASHDLKEPLRGIYDNVQFIIEDFSDKIGDDGQKRLDRLIALTKRLENLINDLLYYSRLGRSDNAIQEIDVKTTIKNVEDTVSVYLKEKNCKITTKENLPPITFDRVRLEEVFRNLIINGAKYNDQQEKHIEIGFLEHARTSMGDEFDVFYVKDNGIGIDKAFHSEIFRMFRKLNPGNKYDPGTGAGLTFVKKIIERQGGRIWLDSEPGIGSTFYFTLSKTRRLVNE